MREHRLVSICLWPNHQHRLLSREKTQGETGQRMRKKMSLRRNRERSSLFGKMAGDTGIANLNNREHEILLNLFCNCGTEI